MVPNVQLLNPTEKNDIFLVMQFCIYKTKLIGIKHMKNMYNKF
jgi:hypothetical protein